MAALLGRNVVRTIIKGDLIFALIFSLDFCPSRISASNAHTKPIRYPQVSYNDMTKPEGPWKAKYDKMNAQYSRYMYAGLATLCVSVGIVSVHFGLLTAACRHSMYLMYLSTRNFRTETPQKVWRF